MKPFYVIEPEVAGGWGAKTIFAKTPEKNVVVQRLHFEFDGWLGDELLESTPCYIVTERLARDMRDARLTGVAFDKVEITKSPQFKSRHPGRYLPPFVWLKVNGTPGLDDVGIAPGRKFVVSGRALNVLQQGGLLNAASITPYTPRQP